MVSMRAGRFLHATTVLIFAAPSIGACPIDYLVPASPPSECRERTFLHLRSAQSWLFERSRIAMDLDHNSAPLTAPASADREYSSST